MSALVTKFQPDLIVLDFHLSTESGLEVLEGLQPLIVGAVPVPVLMVGSAITAQAKQAALAAGASDFLSEAWDPAEVLPRVQDLLAGRFRGLREGGAGDDGGLANGGTARAQDHEDAFVGALDRLALAAEYRDDLTRGEHVKRVGQTAALLARSLGLPEEQVRMIRLAAPLHDIGKLAIPESILLKPGRLTAEEFDIVKTHTTIGATMLAGSRHPVLQMAEGIARFHHERWDGAGFPQGLRGEAIPLEARIVAVADAFDAMNSDRPYRKAFSSEEVWNILVDGAGRQWDLAVVDALASLVQMDLHVDRPFDLAAFLEREQMALDPRR